MSAAAEGAGLETVARGAGTALVGTLLARLLNLAAQLLLARRLGAEGFGVYTLGFGVAQLSETLARAGVHQGGVRRASVRHGAGDAPGLVRVLAASLALSLAASAAVALALALLAPALAGGLLRKPEAAPAVRLFALTLPLSAGAGVVAALLTGFHRTGESVLVRALLQPLLHVSFLLALLPPAGSPLRARGLAAGVLAWALSQALALAAGLHLYRRRLPAAAPLPRGLLAEARALARESLPLLAGGGLQLLLSWVDVLVLGRLGSSADVGRYRVATQVARLLTLGGNALNSIYAPLAAHLAARGETRELARLLRAVTRWGAAAALPLFVFLAAAATPLLLLFGRDYAAAAPALVVLAAGQLVAALAGGSAPTLVMAGRAPLEAANLALAVPLQALLALALVPRAGATGAAAATALALLLLNLARWAELRRAFAFDPFRPAPWGLLAPAAAAALLLAALGGVLPAGAGRLAASALVPAGAMLAWLAFAPRDPEDALLLSRLGARLGDRLRLRRRPVREEP